MSLHVRVSRRMLPGTGAFVRMSCVAVAVSTPSLNAQLVLVDPEIAARLYFDFRNPPRPTLDECLCITVDDDTVWIGTTLGAIRWLPSSDKWSLIRAAADWDADAMHRMGARPQRGGDPPDKALRAYAQAWLANSVHDIIKLRPGLLWADCFVGGVLVGDGRADVFRSKERAFEQLLQNSDRKALASLVAVDAEGRMWATVLQDEAWKYVIRCYGGVAWSDVPQPAVSCGPAGSPIHRVVADEKGRIWGCGAGGIFRRREGEWERVLHSDLNDGSQAFFDAAQFTGGHVWAFGINRLARLEGDAWVEYRVKGLTRMFGARKSAVERQGELWCAVADHVGSGVLGFKDGRSERKPEFGRVVAICDHEPDDLWVCSTESVWRRRSGAWAEVDLPSIVGALELSDCAIGRDGTVYLASRHGVWVRRDTEWRRKQFKSP